MVVRVRKFRLSPSGAVGLIAGLLLSGSSCGDRVRNEVIEGLGPEDPKVPIGPLHRPGQPCVACHDEELGNAEPPFTLGGTVYLDMMSNTPADNVEVTVIDVQGRSFTALTNCAGNFFVKPSEFVPVYPIWLEMDAGMVHRSMETPSFREASCATCHFDPKGRESAGHVYLIDDPTIEIPPPSQCR